MTNYNQHQQRCNKKEQIRQFFVENLGTHSSSATLHARFGSAFRTRVSELNRDIACTIVIRNRVLFKDGVEESVYWSEPKPALSPIGENMALFNQGGQ